MNYSNHENRFDPRQIKRDTIRRLLITGLISLTLVISFFFIFFQIYPHISALTESNSTEGGSNSAPWDLLEGISSVITLSLLIGGLVFMFLEYFPNAIQQRREAAEASFSIYKELFDRLTAPEAMEARRWILVNLPLPEDFEQKEEWLEICNEKLTRRPENWEGDRPPGRAYLKQVLNLFDFIGLTAKYYWNMENELVEWMSPSIAKIWERIAPIVEDEAERRNEPDFYQSAREFGEHCIKWREKHFHSSKIIGDAT